jgi:membrane-bound inhibitor of C-type lysozyme
MKTAIYGMLLLALTACTNNTIIKKNRNLDFNCENNFKIRFSEKSTITNSDTTTKITLKVQSPKLNRTFDLEQTRAASGVRYATKDGKYIFWEHQGEFTFGTEDSTYCLCK